MLRNFLFWLNFGFWTSIIILGEWVIYKWEVDWIVNRILQIILSILYALAGIMLMIGMMKLIIGG